MSRPEEVDVGKGGVEEWGMQISEERSQLALIT